MYHHQMRLIIILIAQTVLLEAHDATSNKSTKKKSLHMSKIAKDHLSDENNPNDFPKLLGIPFSGCDVHPLMEQSSELVKLVATYGTDADATTLQELAQGFDALQSCSPEESFEIFDAIIQHFPESIFAYIGRGISLGRLANKIKASSESAMKDFDHVMKLKPHFYMAYRCKAEVHFLTGHFKEAMKEAENDLQYKHDGAAYAMAGILSYKLERDYEASQYLVKSHQYVSGHNSVTYEYLGLAYLNMGLLRKSADALKTSLEYEGENMNVCQTLGILYSELGEPEPAHFYLDSALDIKLDESKTMEIKGHVYYASGYPETAVDWYFGCKVKDHSATSCSFMRAVSFATLGRFYESVKLMTFLMLQSSCNSEYREPLYLRDFYRFISRRLDRTLTEYRFDEELPENYRYVWAKKILPNHFNYTEQPGIEPHLKDVDQSITFDDLSDNAKILLCRASEFAYLFQYQVDGFMPNRRANLAMALAAMDVAQTMRNYWKNPKKTKGWKGRQFSWRDLFEVGVKWRKLVSMEQPVLWLDQLPKQIVDAGFITHMFMKKGHVEMPRYAKYMDEALQLAKFMIRSLLNQKLPAKAQEQIMKATTPTEILMILRKYHSTNPNGGFTVGMQVPSSRPKGGLLHGVMLSISGNTEEDITLSIQSARTSAQINQYHSELAYVFSELRDDVTKKKTKDNEKDSTSNLILQLVYYFYNLLPLSRGTSAVAYSVAMGLFMAGNKEFTSQLPGDLQPDIEAYFAGSSEAFIKKMRFWLTLKTMQPPIQNYPSVTDTFETARSILETLNVKVTERTCKNWKVT